jgi:hypothetical protein
LLRASSPRKPTHGTSRLRLSLAGRIVAEPFTGDYPATCKSS